MTPKKLLYQVMMETAFHIPFLRGHVGNDIYPFMFSPVQLMFLANAARQAALPKGKGSFVEAGCAYGASTIFLNLLLKELGRSDLSYHAIDTFSGFTEQDLAHEIGHRGKSKSLGQRFIVNNVKWFLATLKSYGLDSVNVYQTDVSLFEFTTIDPIRFCLLDVDLYLPTKNALPKLFDNLHPNGIIVVDDVAPNRIFDGALQAYCEFVAEKGLPERIVHGKLGLIYGSSWSEVP